MQIPDTKIIKYLLGNLNESEAQEISLRIIEDKSFENEMLFAESELIETFLEKSLTPEETKLFQTNFLINEERENHLKELYLLKKYASNKHRQEEVSEIQEKHSPGFWENLKDLFPANLKPVSAILTILIVALLAGAAWLVFFTRPDIVMSQLEKQYAEINRRDLNNAPELTISPIALISGVLRSANENSTIESSKIGDNVFFRLALPFEIKDREFLRVELTKDNKTIFTQNEVRIYKNQNGQELKLILPKSVLPRGQYQIIAENPGSEISPVNYAFVVE